jgi:hypothetical protein
MIATLRFASRQIHWCFVTQQRQGNTHSSTLACVITCLLSRCLAMLWSFTLQYNELVSIHMNIDLVKGNTIITALYSISGTKAVTAIKMLNISITSEILIILLLLLDDVLMLGTKEIFKCHKPSLFFRWHPHSS